MQASQYRKIVRASAIYDLAVTAPFATPWSFAFVLSLLAKLSPIPPFQPEHMLFANLLGSVVVIWALVRIRDPQPVFGLFDSAGRALFFTWQIYFLLAFHISPSVWGFAIFEFVWCVVQLAGFLLLWRDDSRVAWARA